MQTRSRKNSKFVLKAKKWLAINRWKLIILFLIYQFSIIVIGLVNYPYIDDINRQITGMTDFARTYSRWGSEITSWLVQGSRHLTDLGLTTHILTAFIMTITSVIVVFVINRNLEWFPIIGSALLGLNPWFLQCISFRFDSPYMALSILVSVIPFFWWKETKRFFIVSIIGIFLMCNFYQPSSGIYIIMVLALIFRDLMNGEKFVLALKMGLLSALAFVIGMIIFLGETRLNPDIANRGGSVAIASISEFPATIINNIDIYLNTILNQSANIWLFSSVLLAIVFCLSNFVRSKINPGLRIMYTVLYLSLSAILSYGVLLVFIEPLATLTPRYAFGMGAFMSILVISASQPLKIKWQDFLAKCVSAFFLYYMLSFPFTYASTLSYQIESFERQSIVLVTDLDDIVTNERRTVYINRLFSDSKIYLNTVNNFPILSNLVPSNGSLYWPNVMLFNTYSNFNLEMFVSDFSNLDVSDKTLEVSNFYYDIYTTNDEIYVIMK